MNVELRQGPVTPAAQATFMEKYCQPGEDYRQVANRVAYALSDSSEHYHETRNIILNKAFIPAGRILATAGSTKRTTPFNCFVSGTIEDSLVGEGSIMARLHEAAATMRMGGGIGYDFSTLRPDKDYIAGLDSYSTGPLSFMRIYNQTGLCIHSSGHRRGAQMGVLRVDHPDIEAFVAAKQNQTEYQGFNLSVAVTDEFMEAVELNGPFDLRFNGRVYRTIRARDLWEAIMRSTWDWAEPGVLFIDRINQLNNLHYCEYIAATNPCAEQPLPPYGACLLGSLNLTAFLRPMTMVDAKYRYYLDLEAIERAVPTVVRALDNVIDMALYPLEAQMREALSKRRLGIGVMGVANAIEACGHEYGSGDFILLLRDVLRTICHTAYRASIKLAQEKGPFPMFSRKEYLDSVFIQSLPADIKDGIARYGIRNSHLTSIAPTGTISWCMDNLSSGIEPVYAVSQERMVRSASGEQVHRVMDYGYAFLNVYPKTADQVSVKEHLDVLIACQEFVDSSISKTCNVGGNVTWKEFKQVYMDAWRGGAKGCTTFRSDGKRFGIVKEVKECEGGRCALG